MSSSVTDSAGPIDDFSAQFHWLSNFSPSPIDFEGDLYMTVENAFQAAKTTDHRARALIRDCGPDEAKMRGMHVPLRESWDEMRVAVMESLLEAKFTIPALRSRLIATAPRVIVNRNVFGDTFWGICRGQGRNELGKAIMRVRDQVIDPSAVRP
jgi:ribA/ribD-fused uncharacterized protein